MGQQQLLLIILGVIIVGIAVAVGISMFTASATAANRDAVSSDLTNLASLAQQHYRRPSAMGGGANSFDGTATTPPGSRWTIPGQLDTTANGYYSAAVSAQQVVITGVGLETGDSPTLTNGITPYVGKVELRTTVTPTVITAVKIN